MVYLSSPAQFIVGMLEYMTARNDYARARAARKIKYSYRAFIPGSYAFSDMMKLLRGKYTWKDYLFYTEQRQKGKGPWLKPEWRTGFKKVELVKFS